MRLDLASSPFAPSEVEGPRRAKPRLTFSASLEWVSRLRSTRTGVAIALAVAFLAAAPAEAGERQKATVLMSENEGARRFQEDWGFSDAVITGDTIYLSGIVVGRRGSEELGAAYERFYRQAEGVLKRAGASWDDVVDISSFHTDVEPQVPAMAAVHKRFVKAPYPAWTAIGVAKILGNGITEIKVVAKRPEGARAKS